MNPQWICKRCGFSDELSRYYWRCPRCGAPLDLSYEVKWSPRGTGVSRYSSMLPIDPGYLLGEGNTPLISRDISGHRIYFKLEYLNPSGSFKDRGTSLSLYLAKKLGYKIVVEDTSGNTGISVATYASALGLRAKIYMPRTAPRGKKAVVEMLGAEVIETGSRHEASIRVLEAINQPSIFYVAHTWSPLYISGAETIAYEVYEQGFRKGTVVIPIGSGGLFLGIVRGFTNLVELGLLDDMPQIIGVQGYSVHPVYRELYGRSHKGSSNLADGIMVPNPPRLTEIVSLIKKYKWGIVLVGNNEITNALKNLYRMGFIVEPTSAAALAGFYKALRQGLVTGENILIPLTGSGLKTIDTIIQLSLNNC